MEIVLVEETDTEWGRSD